MIFKDRFSELIRGYKSDREFLRIFNAADPDDITLTSSAIADFKNRKNDRMPRAELIVKLASFFGVSTDYLLGVSDDKTKDESIKAAAAKIGLSADVLEKYCATGAPGDNEHRSIIEFLLLDYHSTYERQKGCSRVFDDSLLSRLHNALLLPQNSDSSYFLVEANELFQNKSFDFLEKENQTPVISTDDYQEFCRLRLNHKVSECEKAYTDYLADHIYRKTVIAHPDGKIEEI